MRNSTPIPLNAVGESFFNLYCSSRDLVNRFGVEQDLRAAYEKFSEECVEFHREIALLENYPEEANVQHIAEEAVDVIVTLINLLRPAGVSTALLVETMHKVAEKNDAKDHSTHVVHNGLITRRSKLENNGNG